MSGFHLEKLIMSYTNRYKTNISENTHFDIKPLNKIVSEWSIYPIETVKIWFGSGLNFSSKFYEVSQNDKKSAISQKVHIFAQYTP